MKARKYALILVLGLLSFSPIASAQSSGSAVQEIAPGVQSVDGGAVQSISVDIAALEAALAKKPSLSIVTKMLGAAPVVSPGPNGTMVHMYKVKDSATGAEKVALFFVQGRDKIIDHLIT